MGSIIARLQTPANEKGERDDIHYITESKAVIMDNAKTLETTVSELKPQLAADKPNFACFWAKVKSTETSND